MGRRWMFGAAAVLVLGAGVLFLTERPLTVSVVQPEQDVALRIYGLGSVEARILSRVGFEVGAALTALIRDSGIRCLRDRWWMQASRRPHPCRGGPARHRHQLRGCDCLCRVAVGADRR